MLDTSSVVLRLIEWLLVAAVAFLGGNVLFSC